MRRFHFCLAGFLFACILLGGRPSVTLAEEQACAEALARMEEHNRRISDDLRRIHREMAALRSKLDEPGLPEVIGGIGYIAGIFGAIFFVAGRRRG